MTERDKRLAEFARVAVALEHRIKYPPTLLIAQWALESGWGERTSGDFNYFGITYNPLRHQRYAWCPTHEEMTETQILALPKDEAATITSKTLIRSGVFHISLRRKFASYGSLNEALTDKTSLIMNADRYALAFADYRITGDVERLIDRVAAAGYATAGGYGDTLKQIARQGNVVQAIRKARQEMAA